MECLAAHLDVTAEVDVDTPHLNPLLLVLSTTDGCKTGAEDIKSQGLSLVTCRSQLRDEPWRCDVTLQQAMCKIKTCCENRDVYQHV